MVNYKVIFGLAAVVIGFLGYVPYFLDIARNKTRPHIFSWLIWAILEATVFFAQIVRGAGAGAWVTGVTAILCLSVFVSAIKKGEKNITRVDWICLAGATLGIGVWLATKNPFSAVIIISITDFVGFVPTYRKSYHKPQEETATLYAFSSLKLVFALVALESFNLTTALYPASLVVTNAFFVLMLLVRRRALGINGSLNS